MGPPRGGDQLAKVFFLFCGELAKVFFFFFYGELAKVFDSAVRIRDSPVPPPRGKKKGRSAGVRVRKVDEDDDCVILDGDPHRPVAIVGAKGRSAVGGASDDEVEIVAVKGEIACKDFPHSCHLCSDLPFSTTPHVKHCNMCYCFVCDAPAPCKYWWKGLLYEDHCHATEKETKWKTLRQLFKYKTLPAPYQEKHTNVVYPTTPSPRQQEYYEEYTPEEYRGEDEGGYFEPDDEATVCVRNLPNDIDSEDLAELFEDTGIVMFSEIIYDRETGQSCECGFVTMSTVQEAEMAVELYHRRELYGRLISVTMETAAASPRGARAEETPSPRRSVQSSMLKLYVGNLPWEVDGYELKQLFSEYGEVVHAKVVYNHGLGAPGDLVSSRWQHGRNPRTPFWISTNRSGGDVNCECELQQRKGHGEALSLRCCTGNFIGRMILGLRSEIS